MYKIVEQLTDRFAQNNGDTLSMNQFTPNSRYNTQFKMLNH